VYIRRQVWIHDKNINILIASINMLISRRCIGVSDKFFRYKEKRALKFQMLRIGRNSEIIT
jgi:hypothetical protein